MILSAVMLLAFVLLVNVLSCHVFSMQNHGSTSNHPAGSREGCKGGNTDEPSRSPRWKG